ncbi:MAG: MerR family transcriptional regulator [Alphaproteobacteria bacterium]|nr:MerR family transcriptional regulator [Alphaproteobacteria bacterium]
MRYTIGQVAKKLGLTAHTLRYYDKEGLLPFVKKGSSGARVFEDDDLDWLLILECLKATGMHLKDIKKYMDLCLVGDSTLQERMNMFVRQKKRIEEQMQQLNQYMEKIDFKIAYYTEAVKNGSTDIYKKNKYLAQERERIFGHK